VKKAKPNIDFLLVLHNNSAINLFNSNSPDWVKNLKNFNVNFLVRCPTELEKNIIPPTNSSLLSFGFHSLGPRGKFGSLSHTFNLHRLLKEITSDFFIVSDPDVEYLGDWCQKDLTEVLDSYDLFGIPYPSSLTSSDSEGRYSHMPSVMNTFFRSKSFFEKLKKFGLMKDDKFWIFYPATKAWNLNYLQANLDKSIPFFEEILDYYSYEKQYNNEERVFFMPYSPKTFVKKQSTINYRGTDTSWLNPIVFEDLKYLILPEIESNTSADKHQYKSIIINHQKRGTVEPIEYQ